MVVTCRRVGEGMGTEGCGDWRGRTEGVGMARQKKLGRKGEGEVRSWGWLVCAVWTLVPVGTFNKHTGKAPLPLPPLLPHQPSATPTIIHPLTLHFASTPHTNSPCPNPSPSPTLPCPVPSINPTRHCPLPSSLRSPCPVPLASSGIEEAVGTLSRLCLDRGEDGRKKGGGKGNGESLQLPQLSFAAGGEPKAPAALPKINGGSGVKGGGYLRAVVGAWTAERSISARSFVAHANYTHLSSPNN